MIHIDFTASEIETLKFERFNHPRPSVQMKCEALLLKAYGVSSTRIAAILGVTPNTVRNYFYEYIKEGVDGLTKNRYKGQPTSLSNHQMSIEEEFSADPPSSVAEAVERIERLTGVKRGQTQVRSFMKRIGMGYRKTAPIPAKADQQQQEEFKKNNSIQELQKPKRASVWCFS